MVTSGKREPKARSEFFGVNRNVRSRIWRSDSSNHAGKLDHLLAVAENGAQNVIFMLGNSTRSVRCRIWSSDSSNHAGKLDHLLAVAENGAQNVIFMLGNLTRSVRCRIWSSECYPCVGKLDQNRGGKVTDMKVGK